MISIYLYTKDIIKRFIIFTLTILSIAAFGCQATPEKEAVINKQEDYLIGKEQQVFTKYDAPSYVGQSNTSNGLLIVYDADVSIPEVNSCSVTQVEQIHFSDEYIMSLFDYFSGRSPLFQDAIFTKQQIANSIVELQHSNLQNDELQKSLMADYLEALEAAPEDNSDYLQPFSLEDISSGQRFYAYSTFADENTFSAFSGTRNGASFGYKRNANMSFIREDNLDDHLDSNIQKDFEGEFPVSYNRALETAERIVEDLEIENMALDFGNKACTYYDYGIGSKGWEFIFSRENNGMPSYYVDGATLWNTDVLPSLTAPWDKEVLFILVDNEGVFRFDWRGASKQTSLVMENVELLPFDEILKRAERQLVYQHAVLTDNSYDELSLYIYRIRLGTVMVNVPDNPEVGRMIPAWDILYEIRIKDDSTEVYNKHITCLNAIDGSYIEPRLQ